MPIVNTGRVLDFLPLAMGAYGTGPGTTGRIVGSAAPVEVDRFKATPGSGFQGSLYKDPATGKYTIAFAGTNDPTDLVRSDRVLATSNLLTAIGAGAWDPQMTDAIKFTIESFKQIQKEYIDRKEEPPSIDDLRQMVTVTGHSLGGSLAELSAKFFGLNGANIDGPGVMASTSQAQYAALHTEAQTAFAGMQPNYSLGRDQFGAYAYTVVGVAGTHLDGIEVQRTPRGESATEADYQKAADAAQTTQVGTALGLMQSIIGLDKWEHMSDLQRVAAITSIYNTVDKLAGNALPGDLGGAVSVLGLLNALDKGDIGGIAYSGIALGNALSESGLGASEAIASALGMEAASAANILPGLGLESGNPKSILAASLGIASPGYGPQRQAANDDFARRTA
jgi:hypothetical protein